MNFLYEIYSKSLFYIRKPKKKEDFTLKMHNNKILIPIIFKFHI